MVTGISFNCPLNLAPRSGSLAFLGASQELRNSIKQIVTSFEVMAVAHPFLLLTFKWTHPLHWGTIGVWFGRGEARAPASGTKIDLCFDYPSLVRSNYIKQVLFLLHQFLCIISNKFTLCEYAFYEFFNYILYVKLIKPIYFYKSLVSWYITGTHIVPQNILYWTFTYISLGDDGANQSFQQSLLAPREVYVLASLTLFFKC